jgi:hypothetical protein
MALLECPIPHVWQTRAKYSTPYGEGKTHVLIALYHLLVQWIDLSFTLYYTFTVR